MFKKKPIYIVGVVVFTLLLIVDLAVYFLVPAGQGNMPSFGGQTSGGSFNFGDFEGFGGQMPDMGDFDFSGMGGQFPGGFGGSQTVDTESGDLASSIREAFWPILIISLFGDGACIFMLVRISRKESENEELQEAEDDLQRGKRTNTALAVVAGVLVVAVVLTNLPDGNAGGSIETEISVEEATASLTELVAAFSGSGTLASSEALAVEIPAGVSILSYAADKGDVVEAGDVLAYVDKTSVQKTIYELQELLDQLDQELSQVRGNTLADTVQAQASGRIKAIYVAVGDSVAGEMYEHGALLLISLGGSMTVTLESDEDITVGQSLTVTLSDGSTTEGKVQLVEDGKLTVTTTDDGPTPGDTVSVKTEDGTDLGSGTLEVSSPLKVMSYAGTISSISVSLNAVVEAGDTLLTLADTEDLARYQQLLRDREVLTDALAQLAALYQEGTIRATAAGILSQVNETTAVTVAATTGGSFGSQMEQEASYTVEMTSLFAITPAETMTIDISVDELDILSLAVGQEAAITLDALPGQSFAGVVKTINTSGTNDGGSTKYTVTLEVPRSEEMLAGMNASIRIQVSQTESVLTVPAAAIYEDGNRTYVYTALDKNGEPANPVDVTTGSSDGENIEILEGLSTGDTVYYSYADTIVYRFSR